MDAVDTPEKLHIAGELNNSGIKVYVDPNASKNTVLVGYKGKQFSDSGYVYAPYIPMSSIGDPYFEIHGREDFEFDKQ
jgi:hypothetical protein